MAVLIAMSGENSNGIRSSSVAFRLGGTTRDCGSANSSPTEHRSEGSVPFVRVSVPSKAYSREEKSSACQIE